MYNDVLFCCILRNIMRSGSEFSPILSRLPQELGRQKYCSCNVNYTFSRFTEKGSIVMIVCNALALIAICVQSLSIFLKTSTTVTSAVIARITLPIAGIAANIIMYWKVQAYSSNHCDSYTFLSHQSVVNTPSRLSSHHSRNSLCSLYSRIILHWDQLLRGLCLSFYCRPTDRSIWRTAQFYSVLDDVGICHCIPHHTTTSPS